MELLEQLINSLAGSLKTILEGISVLCILVGLLTTVQLAVKQRWRYALSGRQTNRDPDVSLAKIRLNFGLWLSLALEFQLGADIVNTTVAPSLEALIRLGLLALIRTFLNFFLARELDAEENTITQASLSPAQNINA
ncbi:hypothetical protein C7271_25680 [filamentous cyanobacterium CCP5]|nr:hypothetical protein C7271_25680 [filamentous cyanobacterium CCP5]PSN14803.1 hypothetical protein C7293_09965 [filamentous cyanobacterium CCT1]PSN79145.1 hypothetical protein C8B47_13190 [filamentous cyanobacterium CCP4]